jgi:Rrf2 family transcriptional regulator, nitric oxide-sensitive transcriptional repressor
MRTAMRVTLTTDYSLRVLMYLGTRSEGLSTIQDIADRFSISRAHLMKVVHQLALRGYVTTVRGKNGGMKLGMRPEDIVIGAVVRDTEDDLAVIGCLETPGYCVIEKACILRRAFREASLAFLAVLDDYTLADLLKPKSALANLLGLPPRSVSRALVS